VRKSFDESCHNTWDVSKLWSWHWPDPSNHRRKDSLSSFLQQGSRASCPSRTSWTIVHSPEGHIPGECYITTNTKLVDLTDRIEMTMTELAVRHCSLTSVSYIRPHVCLPKFRITFPLSRTRDGCHSPKIKIPRGQGWNIIYSDRLVNRRGDYLRVNKVTVPLDAIHIIEMNGDGFKFRKNILYSRKGPKSTWNSKSNAVGWELWIKS